MQVLLRHMYLVGWDRGPTSLCGFPTYTPERKWYPVIRGGVVRVLNACEGLLQYLETVKIVRCQNLTRDNKHRSISVTVLMCPGFALYTGNYKERVIGRSRSTLNCPREGTSVSTGIDCPLDMESAPLPLGTWKGRTSNG
jgi:hypothetical protein